MTPQMYLLQKLFHFSRESNGIHIQRLCFGFILKGLIRGCTYSTHQEVLVLGVEPEPNLVVVLKWLWFCLFGLGVTQKSKQNQSHLSTTQLWFSFWFCLIINFYKCVSKLRYQNCVDLSTTSRCGSVCSVSSNKEIRVRARTQTELATEPECVLKQL